MRIRPIDKADHRAALKTIEKLRGARSGAPDGDRVDLARRGTLHRATAWGSALLLVRHALHQVIANTDQWQRIAAWLTPPV